MTSSSAADTFLAEITDLFTRLGDLHYGEDVTQMEHALQAAHHAKLDGASPSLVAAALLHDIGHLMQKIGEDAADRLGGGVGEREAHPDRFAEAGVDVVARLEKAPAGLVPHRGPREAMRGVREDFDARAGIDQQAHATAVAGDAVDECGETADGEEQHEGEQRPAGRGGGAIHREGEVPGAAR